MQTSENVGNEQVFLFAGFVWWCYQYLCNRNTLFFALILRLCPCCEIYTEWLFRRVVWALDVYPDMCIGFTDDITITVMCVLFVSVCVQVLNVFSMSLLENDLYVINYQNHSIVKIHRYDPVRPAELVSGTFGSPNIIKVLHQVRQPQCAFTLIYG